MLVVPWAFVSAKQNIGQTRVNYTNYDEFVNSRWQLVVMLNFLHHCIYPPLLTIACRAKHIKSDYNISSGSTVTVMSLTVIRFNVTGPDMGRNKNKAFVFTPVPCLAHGKVPGCTESPA